MELSSGKQASRLLLIGYRGTGKSTVARLVAKRLGWSCVDSDDQVEELAGRTIADIFSQDGEAAFRDMEENAVEELCGGERTVISLGGGAVLRERSRSLVAAAGPVVWLTASPAALAERLGGDSTTGERRPSLTGAGVVEEIEQVLAQRTPIYRGCATLVVDTEGKPPESVADEILQRLAIETARDPSK